ncbi:type IV secretory system conjugative DNA transfer family protein (plasmid) [Thalassospira sp. SM2505]
MKIYKQLTRPYAPCVLFLALAGGSMYATDFGSISLYVTATLLIGTSIGLYFNRDLALTGILLPVLAVSAALFATWRMLQTAIIDLPHFNNARAAYSWLRHSGVENLDIVSLGLSFLPIFLLLFIAFPLAKASLVKVRQVRWRTKAQRSDSDALGSARFADDNEIEKLKGENGLLLGRHDGEIVRAIDKGGKAREGHIQTYGPTRTWKGRAGILPQFALVDHPFIDICPKGETVAITWERREQMGRTFFALDPLGITDNWVSAPTATFNPLALIKNDKTLTERVQALSDALVYSRPGDQSHFIEIVKFFIEGLIAWVTVTYPRDEAHLGTVYDLALLPGDAFDNLLECMSANKTLAHGLPFLGARSVQEVEGDELSGVKSTIKRSLGFLQNPHYRAAMTSNDPRREINLHMIFENKADLVIVVPDHVIERDPRFVRIVFSMAITEFKIWRRSNPMVKRIFTLMDEFLLLGHFPPVVANWNSIAGYGMSFWLFIHERGQLRGLYPKEYTMFNTAEIVQIFGTGIGDDETPEWVSKLLDKFTIITKGEQRNAGAKPGSMTSDANRHIGESVSEGEQSRSLMTPGEIRALDLSEQLLFVRGFRPMKIKKLDYLNDPEFAGLLAQNPLHEEGDAE